jgi:streptogramin lyase
MTTFFMTTKAFSSEPRRTYRMTVDEEGRVWVWDSVSGHYTSCHSMSERSISAARRKAMSAN